MDYITIENYIKLSVIVGLSMMLYARWDYKKQSGCKHTWLPGDLLAWGLFAVIWPWVFLREVVPSSNKGEK